MRAAAAAGRVSHAVSLSRAGVAAPCGSALRHARFKPLTALARSRPLCWPGAGGSRVAQQHWARRVAPTRPASSALLAQKTACGPSPPPVPRRVWSRAWGRWNHRGCVYPRKPKGWARSWRANRTRVGLWPPGGGLKAAGQTSGRVGPGAAELSRVR